MLTLASGIGLNQLYKNNMGLPKKIGKALSGIAMLEIAGCIAMIVIAHKIASNSLPSSLRGLQGRIDIAIGFLATGTTLLAVPAIIVSYLLPEIYIKNVFKPKEGSCTKKKMYQSVNLLITSLAVTAIVMAHLIATNKLPSFLQFLQGRTQLATGLMITGVTVLAFPVLVGVGFNFIIHQFG